MTPTEEPNIHKVNINGLKGKKMKAIQQQHGTLTPTYTSTESSARQKINTESSEIN